MLFVSKYREHRVVLKPTDTMVDDQRRRYVVPGISAEFHDHRYVTEDPDMIQRLLSLKEYGHTFTAACNDQELLAWKKQHGMTTPDEASKLLKKTPLDQPMQPKEHTTIEEGAPAEKVEVVGTKSAKELEEKATALTKEDVKSMIADAMVDILEAVKSMGAPGSVPPIAGAKPRKVFHCKVCGKEFRTGIDIGRHMKADHAEPTSAVPA